MLKKAKVGVRGHSCIIEGRRGEVYGEYQRPALRKDERVSGCKRKKQRVMMNIRRRQRLAKE